jgi:hypothetical protein
MIELIRQLYFGRKVEGMSIIYGPEFDLVQIPWIIRYLREYAFNEPEQLDLNWVLESAQRALIEEQPDALVLPHLRFPFGQIARAARQRGCALLLLGKQDLIDSSELDANDRLGSGLELTGSCLPASAAGPGSVSIAGMVEWLEALPPSRPVSQRPQSLVLVDEKVASSNDLVLSNSIDPEKALSELWSGLKQPLSWLEPVNLNCGLQTFDYGDYTNEYALGLAGHDLKKLLKNLVPQGHAHCSIEDVACQAGEIPESLHQCAKAFRIELSPQPLTARDWLTPFRLDQSKKLNIVFVDSRNVAGSLMNHSLTVNRYTQHNALGLSAERHPFIAYPQPECKMAYLEGDDFEPEVRRQLEQADGFVFFDEDDETNPKWPAYFRQLVWGKPVVHLYVGWKVHQNLERNQRAGRTVLTPLPHILRMYPKAKFYAGFPPATLDDMELKPPRSASDGIIRVLHTPSLPHATLSRYVYHKDTEAFIAASRQLKSRFPNSEFWQLGGVPHRAVLTARQDCDITFNHLRGYISLTGDEALYLERVLVHAFDQFSVNRHREYWGLDIDFPWLNATPQNLAEVLASIFEDPELRLDLGRRGRQFMLEYFSPARGILPLIYHLANAPLAAPMEVPPCR